MLACPACDSPNEDNAQRCVRCGATLPRHAAPAALGQTVLLSTPSAASPSRLGATQHLVVPTQKGGFAPIEAAPATLGGPGPRNVFRPGLEENSPATLQGMADPKARTLMGFGPDASASRTPPAPERPGVGSWPPPQADNLSKQLDGTEPSPTGRSALKGTLMGVSPFVIPQERPTQGGASQAATPAKPAVDAASAQPETAPDGQMGGRRSQGHATILGVAPPIPIAAGTPAGNDRPGQAAQVAAAPHKGTILGVAMPGIAPLHPGQQKSEQAHEHPQASHHRRSTPPQIGPEQHNSSVAAAAIEAAEYASQQRSAQRRRLAWILGLASVLLVVIVAVAALVWWSSVHLAVAITTDDNGDEQLSFTCSNCPDGTTLSLQGKSAEIRAGHSAPLTLPKKLSIGPNRLSVALKRPNRTQVETVNVTVPVEFRVTADLSGLVRELPQLEVVIEAVPQTLIRLDGNTIAVSQSGVVRIPVDVSRELTGASAAVVPLERKLDYVITQRDGTNVTGSLTARTGVTPLEIDAPGLQYVTQNPTFTLSGRTTPKAKLTANGHPITVQADGTFRQDMALSAPGATQLRIRTHEAGLAPRLVAISLERVTDLSQRAEELSKGLFTTYDAIVNMLADKPSSPVALHGEVVAKETVGASTRLVVSASCLQAPCLVSVRHGAPLSFNRGDRIVALGLGRLTKRANTPARDLTIDASLVVEDTTRF